MQISFGQKQVLKQSLTLQLSQSITLANLMAVPDEVMATIMETIVHHPEAVEKTLSEVKTNSAKYDCPDEQIKVIYTNLSPKREAGENNGTKRVGITKEKIISSPEIGSLEDCLKITSPPVLTPDVTYIGRRNNKPEMILSGHLRGTMSLSLLTIEASQFPQTARLLASLKKFDDWKKDVLRRAYVILGERQREYFENFDPVRLNILNQEDFGEELNLTGSTVSRILANRWAEARNLAGEQKYLYVKNHLLVTQHELFKYNNLPEINRLLVEEYALGRAYSDQEIIKKIRGRGLARRTLTKYREDNQIPSSSERNKLYMAKEITAPYQMKAF